MVKKKGPLLLCLDIGNTSASFAVYAGGKPEKIGYSNSSNIPYMVRYLLRKRTNIPSINIVVSSVVPKITKKIRVLVKHKTGVNLWIVGKNLKAPIKHKYRQISRLGNDRLVTAYGGMRIYGCPLLILDYGTALTCDFISEKGVFLGGLIIPGPEISLKCLSERTALLPRIDFPKGGYSAFIGRDTKGCMKAGILQGYGAMTDGLIARFRKRYGNKFRVVATGGLSKVLAPYTTQIDIVDPLLTLNSLARLYKDQLRT